MWHNTLRPHLEILSIICEQLGSAGDLGETVQNQPWHTPPWDEELGVAILQPHPSHISDVPAWVLADGRQHSLARRVPRARGQGGSSSGTVRYRSRVRTGVVLPRTIPGGTMPSCVGLSASWQNSGNQTTLPFHENTDTHNTAACPQSAIGLCHNPA